ncbi:RNA-directed DNA polymerase, eukaryota [Tanacetum coccineum]
MNFIPQRLINLTSLRRDVRGGEESAQLSRISDLLDTVVLSNMGDRRFWDLNGDGCFCVKDVRRLLDDMLLPKSDVPSRWVKQIPIKVNVLAWKISMDRLPTRVNLHRRGVQVSPISCPICCEALENLDHLLFCCDLAKDIARFNQVQNRCWKECFTLPGGVSGHIETISSSLIQIFEKMVFLKT